MRARAVANFDVEANGTNTSCSATSLTNRKPLEHITLDEQY